MNSFCKSLLILSKNCIEYTSKKQIVFIDPEGKAKTDYRLINPKNTEICRIRIDKCLISDKNERKCDFGFYALTDKIQVLGLIELKGKDFRHALEQIYNTLEYLRQKISIKKFIIIRIVPTKSPQVHQLKKQTTYNKVIQLLKNINQLRRQQYNKILDRQIFFKYKTKRIEEKLDDLLNKLEDLN